MEFENKVVLVTGSSQNTGLGIAKRFLQEGAFVFINGPSSEETQKGVAALESSGLGNFLAISADISSQVEVNAMFEKILETKGRLDILINNACDQGIGLRFDQLSPEDFSKVLNVNLLGTFQVSLMAVKMMLSQKEKGVIVNMGSNVSQRAIHHRTAYVSSKGGIEALSRSMAIDLAPQGIRVNCVAPGYIRTNRWDVLPEDTIQRRRDNIPAGREATIEDITEAVIFFASERSRNIYGERLVVDGGCSAQHMPIDIDL